MRYACILTLPCDEVSVYRDFVKKIKFGVFWFADSNVKWKLINHSVQVGFGSCKLSPFFIVAEERPLESVARKPNSFQSAFNFVSKCNPNHRECIKE